MQNKAISSQKKRKHSVLLFLFALLFVSVIMAGCIVNFTKVAADNREMAEISQEIEKAQAKNEELKHFLKDENHDEYFEKIAREEFGYAKPGERVFFDSSYGNKK